VIWGGLVALAEWSCICQYFFYEPANKGLIAYLFEDRAIRGWFLVAVTWFLCAKSWFLDGFYVAVFQRRKIRNF
jgi:hypothetical protein